MYRASVAQSVFAGRSPSCTGCSNHIRNSVTMACLNSASSRRTVSASSPHASGPDTTRHPRALRRSRYIRTNREKMVSTTARAVGLRRASVGNDMGLSTCRSTQCASIQAVVPLSPNVRIDCRARRPPWPPLTKWGKGRSTVYLADRGSGPRPFSCKIYAHRRYSHRGRGANT